MLKSKQAIEAPRGNREYIYDLIFSDFISKTPQRNTVRKCLLKNCTVLDPRILESNHTKYSIENICEHLYQLKQRGFKQTSLRSILDSEIYPSDYLFKNKIECSLEANQFALDLSKSEKVVEVPTEHRRGIMQRIFPHLFGKDGYRLSILYRVLENNCNYLDPKILKLNEKNNEYLSTSKNSTEKFVENLFATNTEDMFSFFEKSIYPLFRLCYKISENGCKPIEKEIDKLYEDLGWLHISKSGEDERKKIIEKIKSKKKQLYEYKRKPLFKWDTTAYKLTDQILNCFKKKFEDFYDLDTNMKSLTNTAEMVKIELTPPNKNSLDIEIDNTTTNYFERFLSAINLLTNCIEGEKLISYFYKGSIDPISSSVIFNRSENCENTNSSLSLQELRYLELLIKEYADFPDDDSKILLIDLLKIADYFYQNKSERLLWDTFTLIISTINYIYSTHYTNRLGSFFNKSAKMYKLYNKVLSQLNEKIDLQFDLYGDTVRCLKSDIDPKEHGNRIGVREGIDLASYKFLSGQFENRNHEINDLQQYYEHHWRLRIAGLRSILTIFKRLVGYEVALYRKKSTQKIEPIISFDQGHKICGAHIFIVPGIKVMMDNIKLTLDEAFPQSKLQEKINDHSFKGNPNHWKELPEYSISPNTLFTSVHKMPVQYEEITTTFEKVMRKSLYRNIFGKKIKFKDFHKVKNFDEDNVLNQIIKDTWNEFVNTQEKFEPSRDSCRTYSPVALMVAKNVINEAYHKTHS